MVNFTAVRSGRKLLFDQKELPPDFDPNKAWGIDKENSEVWKIYQEKQAEKQRRIQEKMQEARAEREAGISKGPTTGTKAVKLATGAVGDAVEIMHPHPASVLHETPFRFMERIYRYDEALVLANPEKLYIFGDNIERKGKAGQAVIRDADNAIGIATKESSRVFMDDVNFEANRAVIDSDIEKIIQEAKKYDSVVFPSDGVGTGLADLKAKAPKTAQYLEERLLYLESQVGIEFRSVEHAYQSLKGNGLDEVAYQKYIDDTRDFSKEPVKITGKKRFRGGNFSENLWVDAGVQAAYENPQRAQEILAVSPDTKITHGAKDKYWRENFEPLFRRIQARVGNISKAPVAAGKTAQATEFFRVPDNATPHSNHYGNRTWYN